MPESTHNDLELVDTESLIKELMRRHDATVVATYRTGIAQGSDQYTYCYDGGAAHALGMIEFFRHGVLANYGPAGIQETPKDDAQG